MKKFNLKSEELEKFINQLIRYNISKEFDSVESIKEWLNTLNEKQILNFNSLTIDPSEIMFPVDLLINENLLNCEDYTARVEAMSKLKNGEGCWHLFENLCSPNFLRSANYYKDMAMISEASTARYALWVINDDNFIKSIYHDVDLKLIVEAEDNVSEDKNSRDWLVAQALATVAMNVNSLNSPYHQQDMQLIASSGSSCLNMSGSTSEDGLNNLAVNAVSLGDKYHLENMQILSSSPIASRYLYMLMTDAKKIKSKYYREEVQALVEAKSLLKARAIYYYIVNPPRDLYNFVLGKLWSELRDVGVESDNIYSLLVGKTVSGIINPKYLHYLKQLNKIDDKFVMFFEALLSSEDSYFSGYQEEDLNLLLTVTDFEIFIDLYSVMSDKTSLASSNHWEDVKLISKTLDKRVRELLVAKATDEHSVNSDNHRHDMDYIAKLDFDNISKERWDRMYHYLFIPIGIEDPEHVTMLEKLYNCEEIETVKRDNVLEYLYDLKEQISSGNYPFEDVAVNNNDSEKAAGAVESKQRFFAKIRKRVGDFFNNL